MNIKYYDRQKNQLGEEKIYGEGAIRWLYESTCGGLFCNVLAGPLFSRFYGFLQDRPLSHKKFEKFIKDYQIPLEDFLPEENYSGELPYSTFNNFFIRKFCSGKRTFNKDFQILPAIAEGRYFGFAENTLETKVPVKGRFLNPLDLLKKDHWAKYFGGGPILIARLCPVDYHRFHFPDEGKVLDRYRAHGFFHSVNPLALRKKENIFITNEREISILETKNFGKLAYIEVGAMCVGKIVQTYKGEHFSRGVEKGYFLFGGSTVILLGEKGLWTPSDDILEKTSRGIETFIQLGDEIGHLQS